MENPQDFLKKIMGKYAENNFKLPESFNFTSDDQIISKKSAEKLDIDTFSKQFEKPRTSFLDFIRNSFNDIFVTQSSISPPNMKPDQSKSDISDTKINLTTSNLAEIQELIGPECDYSFDSSDLVYLKRLNELITKEKQMKMQIQELEAREQSYKTILRETDVKWQKMEEAYKKRLLNITQNEENEQSQYDSLGQELLEENVKLTNEVKNVKIELKHCMKEIEEPIYEELEKEKVRSERLEIALKYNSDDMAKRTVLYKKGMNEFAEQLKSTCASLEDITATNEQLKKEMDVMRSKYEELQEDLTHQKISETRTLKQLEDVISRNSEENL